MDRDPKDKREGAQESGNPPGGEQAPPAQSPEAKSEEMGQPGTSTGPGESGQVGETQPAAEGASYSEEEEEAIAARLRGLGYIE